MELTNEFVVGVEIDEAWAVLTDVERIAPCMPGAELQEVAGDDYRGIVKVKVGPIVAQYKGTATFVERDETGHRAVLRAEGRDTRGQGNANATITAILIPEGGGTRVKVMTELTVTGRAAQFGRGVLADVSNKLIDQFVQRLESDVLAGVPGKADGDGASTAEAMALPRNDAAPDGPRRVESRPAQPVDLLGTAGAPVVKRLVPLGVLVVVLWFILRRGRRRRGKVTARAEA
ncbi:MAG: SRPBCC family protein [Actinomycetota bacterium]